MSSILQILETIGADTKRGYKTALIEQHQTNETFMQVLKLALDPYINFYVRKIPTHTPKGGQTLGWAMSELTKLSERQLTGNAGIEHLRRVLSSVSADDAVVISRIIGKDLRCGMADGTVNSVIDKFIPTYPCILSRPYDSKNIKNIKYPAYSQLKADGLRANAIIENGKVLLCGRSGRVIDLLGAMDADLLNLANQFPTDVVFDGEFVVVDSNGKILNRKTGNGIITKAIKGTITPEDAALIRFQIWDVIPLAEFKAELSVDDYKTRFESLVFAIDAVAGPKCFWTIPYKTVGSLEEAEEHFQEMLSAGNEGTILKNFVALWENARSKHLVKMKAELDCDLRIMRFKPGTGKFLGMVGSIECESEDGLVSASISGFSDELRQWITDNKPALLGTIVAVTYNERIKSKTRTGVDSLFLPRYQEFRSDKTVANTSAEIK